MTSKADRPPNGGLPTRMGPADPLSLLRRATLGVLALYPVGDSGIASEAPTGLTGRLSARPSSLLPDQAASSFLLASPVRGVPNRQGGSCRLNTAGQHPVVGCWYRAGRTRFLESFTKKETQRIGYPAGHVELLTAALYPVALP